MELRTQSCLLQPKTAIVDYGFEILFLTFFSYVFSENF